MHTVKQIYFFSILLGLIISQVKLNAQSAVFNNMYNYTGDTTAFSFNGELWYNNDAFRKVVPLENGDCLITGQSYHSNNNTNNIFHLFQRNLKINNHGLIYDSAMLDIDYSAIETPNFLLVLENNSFLVGSSFRDSLNGEYNLLISKFDNAMVNTWNVFYDYDDYESIASIKHFNNNYYIASNYYTINGVYNSLLIITDSIGIVLDTINFNNNQNLTLNNMDFYPNQNILLLFEVYNNSFGNESNVRLVNITNTGTLNWSKDYFITNNAINRGLGLVISEKDSSLYIGGFVENNIKSNGFVIKTDFEGNLIWQKEYDRANLNYLEGFNNIIQDNNNDIILSGVTKKNKNDFNGVIGPSVGWLLKIDPNGDIIWERTLQRDTFKYLNNEQEDLVYNMSLSSDGGILVCGIGSNVTEKNATDTIKRRNDAWLLKTDSCGFTEGDFPVPSFVVENINKYTITLNNTSTNYCTASINYGNGDSSIFYAYSNPRPEQFTYTFEDTGTYTIKLTALAGEEFRTYENTIRIYGDTTVGIENIPFQDLSISVYPNPANEMLHIYTNQFYNETINYAIYSYEGKLMQTNSLNPQILKNTIAISNLSAGVYTIHFSQKTGAHTTKKIVVIK